MQKCLLICFFGGEKTIDNIMVDALISTFLFPSSNIARGTELSLRAMAQFSLKVLLPHSMLYARRDILSHFSQ